MTTREIVIQSCGCVAIPEEIAGSLAMTPGTALAGVVDEGSRSLTLTSPGAAGTGTIPALMACPIKA
jgi:hypothetical protein